MVEVISLGIMEIASLTSIVNAIKIFGGIKISTS